MDAGTLVILAVVISAGIALVVCVVGLLGVFGDD